MQERLKEIQASWQEVVRNCKRIECLIQEIIKELSIVPDVVIHLPEQAAERARRAILANILVIRIEDDVIVKASPKPDKPGKPDDDKKPPKEKPQLAESLP